jgi:putative ABC transport system substrate-binding protein
MLARSIKPCEAHMRRRSFITLLGGAAAAGWPRAAHAQQPARMRRIGVLVAGAADDPVAQDRVAMFLQGLQELGWAIGRNVQIDYRYGAADDDRLRTIAADLVTLAPDAIVAMSGPSMRALYRTTRDVPIVFANVIDPVGAGYVTSLAHPGGNATGFAGFEYGISGKWLELLKQVAPQVARVAVIRDPTTNPGGGQYGAIQAVAPSLGVEVSPVDVRAAESIERGIAAAARVANSGLIVTGSTIANRPTNRAPIITFAARHQMPAVYYSRNFVTHGGLVSYGAATEDTYRRAAGYVDRILRGEKPADLPVQAPVKYETVLNLKTAKVLGLQVPDIVRLRADEVIE